MTLKVQSKSFVFALLFGFSLCAHAEEKSESLEKQFIDSNIAISNWLDRTAEKIDIFLVGKRVTTKKNETYVRIQSSTFTNEGRAPTNSFSFGFNPRFPNLEEFLQLKFTTDDDRNNTRTTVSNSATVNQKEKNYNAPANLFKKLGSIQTTFQPRIALGNPIKLSHSLNFESVAKFNSAVVNPKLELFADADQGPGFYDAINFQIKLPQPYSLTLINDGEYVDKTHLYTVNNGFSLSQIINDRVTFAYSLIFTSKNQPSYHLENYTIAFAWNEAYYKKILDLQFIPQLDFQKLAHFKGSIGFTFNVSVNF